MNNSYKWKVKLFFAWYDLWIGAYWDRKNRILYICPLPCFVILITRIPKNRGFLYGSEMVDDIR